MGVSFTIEAEMPRYSMEEFKGYWQVQYRLLWAEAVKEFIQDVVEPIPEISGHTREAFTSVVNEFDARVSAHGPTHDYEVWEGWGRTQGWDQVEADFQFLDGGEFVHFQLKNLPDTFKWNAFAGTNYVKYWMKGEKPPWTNRKHPAGVTEPWAWMMGAKDKMVSKIRSEAARLFERSLRNFLKVKARRQRY